MEHSTVLCEVDALAVEHGIDLLLELCALCQVDEQLHSRKKVLVCLFKTSVLNAGAVCRGTHLDGLLCDPLPRKVRDDLVVLMEEELAPSCIPEQLPEVPAEL